MGNRWEGVSRSQIEVLEAQVLSEIEFFGQAFVSTEALGRALGVNGNEHLRAWSEALADAHALGVDRDLNGSRDATQYRFLQRRLPEETVF